MTIEEQVTQEGKVFKSNRVNKSKTFHAGTEIGEVFNFIFDQVETMPKEGNGTIYADIPTLLKDKYIITVTRFND